MKNAVLGGLLATFLIIVAIRLDSSRVERNQQRDAEIYRQVQYISVNDVPSQRPKSSGLTGQHVTQKIGLPMVEKILNAILDLLNPPVETK